MPMKCEGLASKWEGDQGIRRRVLNESAFLMVRPPAETWCQPTRENAKANSSVILPALEMLSNVEGLHLPHLNDLQEEIGKLYASMSISPGQKKIYTTAIEIKKMLGFIKRRVNHREFTKDWAWVGPIDVNKKLKIDHKRNYQNQNKHQQRFNWFPSLQYCIQ